MNSMKFSDRMDGAEAKTLRILGRYSRIRISILYIQSSRQRASKKGSSKKVLRNCPKNRRNRAKFGDLKKHQFWRGFCRILSAPDIKNREKPRKTGFFRVPRCSIRFHSVLRDYHKSASGVSDSKSVCGINRTRVRIPSSPPSETRLNFFGSSEFFVTAQSSHVYSQKESVTPK